MQFTKILCCLLVVPALSLKAYANPIVLPSTPILLVSATEADAQTAAATSAPKSSDSGWFATVDKAQASQPHWITPLVTVTPRIEEEARYDQLWQHQGTGANIDQYGGGKGLELIPTTTNEVIFNIPPYETRSNVKPAQGFGDDTVFLIKQTACTRHVSRSYFHHLTKR
jgi:hypothetical protein